jgi:hypothetical protein
MFERIKSNKVATSAVIVALGLTACGGKDKTANTISACPQGYAKGEKALSNVPEAHRNLQEGVAELRSKFGANAYQAILPNRIKPVYMGAVNVVFEQENNAIMLDSDTKIDEIGEAFCSVRRPSGGLNIYYSPQADMAIGALRTVDIHVQNSVK